MENYRQADETRRERIKVGLEVLAIFLTVWFCTNWFMGRSAAIARRPVVGTWVFDSANSAIPDPAQATLVDQMGSSISYLFKPNGTFTEQPGDIDGSYRVDGHRVILRVSEVDGRAVDSNFEYGQIFLTPDGGHLAVYSRDAPNEVIGLERVGR